MCEHYKPEEVGDSDYGAVYADKPTCELYHDTNDDETEIEGFNRDIERECCVLNFWLVLEQDEDLHNLLVEEVNKSGDYNKSYESFKTKYSV